MTTGTAKRSNATKRTGGSGWDGSNVAFSKLQPIGFALSSGQSRRACVPFARRSSCPTSIIETQPRLQLVAAPSSSRAARPPAGRAQSVKQTRAARGMWCSGRLVCRLADQLGLLPSSQIAAGVSTGSHNGTPP